MKDLALSPEIFDACEKIGNKFSLHIDQIGELDAQIREILLGQAKSSELTRDLQKYLEIDQKLANQIAEEVNKEIFATIKSNLQSRSETNQPLSSLERVGGFSVEKEVVETENSDVTEADRGEILAGLENPQPRVATPGGNPPLNLPTDERSKGMPGAMGVGASINKTSSFTRLTNPTTPDNHTEPLVDYLLSKPAGQSTQKVSAEPTTNPSNPTSTAPKRSGPDPYRESVI